MNGQTGSKDQLRGGPCSANGQGANGSGGGGNDMGGVGRSALLSVGVLSRYPKQGFMRARGGGVVQDPPPGPLTPLGPFFPP